MLAVSVAVSEEWVLGLGRGNVDDRQGQWKGEGVWRRLWVVRAHCRGTLFDGTPRGNVTGGTPRGVSVRRTRLSKVCGYYLVFFIDGLPRGNVTGATPRGGMQ